jgi:hypothetical protein
MNYSVREIDSKIGFVDILNTKPKSDSSLHLTEKLKLKGSYVTSAFDLSRVIRLLKLNCVKYVRLTKFTEEGEMQVGRLGRRWEDYYLN